jgi:hypothetical protein
MVYYNLLELKNMVHHGLLFYIQSLKEVVGIVI